MPDYTVTFERIPEIPVPGMPLGREFRIDSRSLAYPYQVPERVPVADKEWTRHCPILTQEIGSCTGESQAGEVGSDPFYGPVQAAGLVPSDWQDLAMRFYSGATSLDGFPGTFTYPPPPGSGQDTGSDGAAVSQAAKNMGYISGYLHATSVDDVLQALQRVPVKLGIKWWSSFDRPDKNGYVSIAKSAYVRGGHEIMCRRTDASRKWIGPDNSWGEGWGEGGSFWLSWDTLERLLADQGDCTVSVPLTAPAPVPVPVPEDPVAAYLADPRLDRWSQKPHSGDNGYAARQYLWLKDSYTPTP